MANDVRQSRDGTSKRFNDLDVVWWWKLHLDEAVPQFEGGSVTQSNRSLENTNLKEMKFLVNGKRRLAIVIETPTPTEAQLVLCSCESSTRFTLELEDVLGDGVPSYACPELVTYPNSLSGAFALIKDTNRRAMVNQKNKVRRLQAVSRGLPFSNNAIEDKAASGR